MPKGATSKITATFRPMAKIHFNELALIWPADPRIPSAASRRAWSLARNISPNRVNAWWYNRKRVAKRLAIKIPREEYELPVGEPPVVEDDLVKQEDLAMDTLVTPDDDDGPCTLGEGGLGSRNRGRNPKICRRSESEESLDIPLAIICAQNRATKATVKLELIADDDPGSLLAYASSDTAYSPPPPSAAQPSNQKGAYTSGKLYLDDCWPLPDSDLVSRPFSDQTYLEEPHALPLPTGDASLPLLTAPFTQDTSVPALPVCNQGMVTSSVSSSFTCPLCRDPDSVASLLAGPPTNTTLLSDPSSNCSQITKSLRGQFLNPLANAVNPHLPFLSRPSLHVRRDHVRLDDRYYTCDGWLLVDFSPLSTSFDHASDVIVADP